MDFTALYRKYAADVYRFAFYLSGHQADAEDITAETFVRVWTSGERIRMGTVKGYLFTIARNLFLHGVRKRSRHVELDPQLRDPAAGPHEIVEQRARLAFVLAQLQALPEADRAALLMRAFEDLPYEEIALILGLSVSAVKVKVHRARLRLAEIETKSETYV
jgi:RNA polymerase sigma-70 factor (ECF subfamily)